MMSKLLLSTTLLLMGGGLAWVYLRKPATAPSPNPLAGHRPWRKFGAAICLLISVMFVVGVYVVDIPERPIPYALYWIIILGLVVWLIVLAVRDVLYTQQLARRWRAELASREGASPSETEQRMA